MVHPILKLRQELGEYNFVQELYVYSDCFEQYFRLNKGHFDRLLALVGPNIRRMQTDLRKPISPRGAVVGAYDALCPLGRASNHHN